MKREMPVVLEYFLRVAIQAPAYLASLFPVDKPGVQVVELTMQAAPVDGLQQKVPAVVASLAFNECRQGTVNLDVPHLFQRNFPCLQHEVLDSGGIQPLCPYEDLVAEWRKACLLPQVQFLACKSFVAFSDQCLQQGIVWMARLYQDAPGFRRTTRATGDLDQQLGRAFRCSEVRIQQSMVCIENADKRHIRQVMPLGQHLRADKYRGITLMDTVERAVKASLSACRVPIDPDDRYLRKDLCNCLLEALGSLAKKYQRLLSATFRTFHGPGLLVSAVVTPEPRGLAVPRHARIAMPAFGDPAACMAGELGGVTSTVEKKNHLVAGIGLLAYRLDQIR